MASVSVSVVYACFECGYDEPEETLHASNHLFLRETRFQSKVWWTLRVQHHALV